MNPFDLHAVYREAWASFEALRRLGFASEDIFVQAGESLDAGLVQAPSYQLGVILRAQHKEFIIDCGRIPEEPDAIEATWQRFCKAINDREVSERDLQRVWETSHAREQVVGLLTALTAKGFVFPHVIN